MSKKDKFFERGIVRQTIVSLSVSMSFFYIGLVRGYSSPAMPSILELNPELLPTKIIATWASSIPPSGALLGSILAAPLLQHMGRKYAIIAASPLGAIAWILIATADRYEIVIAGRFLSGFAVGLCMASAQVYIGETCDPKVRGILGSLPSIFLSLAILVVYIIGSIASWASLAWFCSFMSLSFGIFLSFLPESPVWLRSKERYEAANAASAWLKLPIMQLNDPEKEEIELSEKLLQDESVSYFSRPILLPLIIGLTLLVLQQISGIDAIIFFTVEIFRSSGSSINSNLATVLVGLVQLVSNIVALFVVDRAGRKPLLILSAVTMCISMASMGTAFYLKQLNIDNYGWLPLASLVVYMAGFSLGFGCVPYLYLGELFPVKQRSVLSSIAGSFNLGFMFIVITTYHYLEELITTAGTFWMYSIFCALGVIFVVFVVPETKGKDLDSIAKLFAKKKKQRKAAIESDK